jgi:mannose-6-phosphate isomerase
MYPPIFLQPVFKERIWGGTKLRELFDYAIPSQHTGECWAVSSHPNGQSIVKGGVFSGMTLGELWETMPELFGSKAAKFPLLTKILDASDHLSVQVHPDDTYAQKYENGELGKTECWYIVDCEPGAEIIFGHSAASITELEDKIRLGLWDELLCRIPVKSGDFFYVPSGTLHALGKGIVVLETQQSSDTTYRVYDYGRRDDAGNLRELHLDKAIDVTSVPHVSLRMEYRTEIIGNTRIITYVSNEYFTVQKWEINGSINLSHDKYTICSVLSGEGKLMAGNALWPLKKGDHFLLPLGFGSFLMDGRLDLIVSSE